MNKFNVNFEGFFSKLNLFIAPKKAWNGLTGYITNEFVSKNTEGYPDAVHYICGPEKMREICENALKQKGQTIYTERFVGSSSSIANSNKNAVLKVNFGKKEHDIKLAENSLLDGMLAAKPNPPHACKMGTCGSCKATLVSGEVIVARDFALNEADRAANKILCCQSWAKTAEIVIKF